MEILDKFKEFMEEKVPELYLIKFQEFLLSAGIFYEASYLLTLILLFILLFEMFLIILNLIFNLNIIFLLIPFLIIPIFISYILILSERRINEIENAAPDFLRQFASVLRVGLSFENAMENISSYGSGPLNDEIRRTIVEIKMGKNFDEAWESFILRLNSKELKRVFAIILDGRKSGTSLGTVMEDISADLRDMLILKRERRASVMMAVMFLIISAIIAAPFSLAMVNIYSSFMTTLGKGGDLIQASVFAGQSYVIIHSILVGFIIGLIMYGDFKKGFKYSIPLTILAYSIYYLISNFASNLFVF